jgi:hypothetical protein
VANNIQKHARRIGTTLIGPRATTTWRRTLLQSSSSRRDGEAVKAEYREKREPATCTADRNIVIREGSYYDYEKLSWLHYRESRFIEA